MSAPLRFMNPDSCSRAFVKKYGGAKGFDCGTDPSTNEPDCAMSSSPHAQFPYTMEGCKNCISNCRSSVADIDQPDGNQPVSDNDKPKKKKPSQRMSNITIMFIGIGIVLFLVFILLIFRLIS